MKKQLQFMHKELRYETNRFAEFMMVGALYGLLLPFYFIFSCWEVLWCWLRHKKTLRQVEYGGGYTARCEQCNRSFFEQR